MWCLVKTVFEHSFDESILPQGGYVLDAGCGRDFFFAKEMARNGFNVICLDPNPKIKDIPNEVTFIPKALTAAKNGNLKMHLCQDADASTIMYTDRDTFKKTILEVVEVETCTIEDLMSQLNIKKFDLIKMDIEGSEYEILMNIDNLLPGQMSVEFHDFRNMNPFYPNNELYYEKLMLKIGKWYDMIDNISPKPKWMNAQGKHWYTLFRIKQ